MKKNIGPYLDYLDVLTNNYIVGEKRTQILTSIQYIKSRVEDPVLTIAMVGEFSSGKSTLINAFVRKSLLKTAAWATTSTSIFIEKTDSEFSVTVSFLDKKIEASEADYGELLDEVRKYSNSDIQSIDELVQTLTSHQEIANQIDTIFLEVPDSSIPKGIRLIDTPGINPGDDSARGHLEITTRITQEIADMSIVVFPAYAPISATLEHFMQEHLKRYLHRSIFVISKMDDEPEYTRQEIESYVRERLVSKLKLHNPLVFSESAIAMLPVKKIPLSKQHEWEKWQDEFIAFEDRIWTELEAKKETIISEHLYFRLFPILIELQDLLKLHKEKLIESKEAVQQERITTVNLLSQLTQFLQQSSFDAKSKVEKSIKQVDNRVKNRKSTYSKKSNATTEGIIEEGDHLYAFEREEQPKITNHVEAYAAEYQEDTNSSFRTKLHDTKNEIISSYNDEFQKLFPLFPLLDRDISIGTVKTLSPQIDFSTSIDFLKEEKLKKIKAGVIFGGIVGLVFNDMFDKHIVITVLVGILLGVLFTYAANHFGTHENKKFMYAIAGGVIGYILALHVKGVSLGIIWGLVTAHLSGDPWKNQYAVKTKTKESISSFFDEQKVLLRDELKRQQEALLKEVDVFFMNYLITYGSVLEAKIEKQNIREQELQDQIDLITKELEKLTWIENDFTKKNAALKLQ